jgi:hypothetical protein
LRRRAQVRWPFLLPLSYRQAVIVLLAGLVAGWLAVRLIVPVVERDALGGMIGVGDALRQVALAASALTLAAATIALGLCEAANRLRRLRLLRQGGPDREVEFLTSLGRRPADD